MTVDSMAVVRAPEDDPVRVLTHAVRASLDSIDLAHAHRFSLASLRRQDALAMTLRSGRLIQEVKDAS